MYRELKENRPHGTKEYPYTQYFINEPKKAFHVPIHWHDEMEIIYIQKGKLWIIVQEERLEGKEGDMFFVNPKALHFMESEDLSVEYYTLLFPMEFISFQSDDMLEQKKQAFPMTIKDDCVEREIRERIRQVIAVNNRKDYGYKLRTRILLLEMIELFLLNHCFLPMPNGNDAEFQREMISYIQEHYTEKITLQMLAEEFHLSEKYISEYFKNHFSISFMQYVGHLRMTKAKKLLLDSELQVTEVALACGFNSVNLFIRKFKELFQMTPLQYRKRDLEKDGKTIDTY